VNPLADGVSAEVLASISIPDAGILIGVVILLIQVFLQPGKATSGGVALGGFVSPTAGRAGSTK
jgi:hypothetical protein